MGSGGLEVSLSLWGWVAAYVVLIYVGLFRSIGRSGGCSDGRSGAWLAA